MYIQIDTYIFVLIYCNYLLLEFRRLMQTGAEYGARITIGCTNSAGIVTHMIFSSLTLNTSHFQYR